MKRPALVALLVLALLAACVPADHSLELGSVQFTIGASFISERDASDPYVFVDFWHVVIDRAVVSFKTVTIGQIGQPDRCSYRGRGALGNVVFDVRTPNVQTFNGIEPTSCPDVGIVLGVPDDATVLGGGVTSADLVELAVAQAHALIEATATREDHPTYHVKLLFDTDTTSSRFGGCHAAEKGVVIQPLERQEIDFGFGAETVFRDGISTEANLRFDPYVDADVNGDRIVTLGELDAMLLSRAQVYNEFYQQQEGTTTGSFGRYVRSLFKLAFSYRDLGQCLGNAPGTE